VTVKKIDFGGLLRLHVHRKAGSRVTRRTIAAEKILIATNAGSVELGEELFGKEPAEPKLTFALATAPVSKKVLAEIGMGSRRPFYTVDLPYLWGKLMKSGAMVFGGGLMPGWGESMRTESQKKKAAKFDRAKLWSGLEKLDAEKGEAKERL